MLKPSEFYDASTTIMDCLYEVAQEIDVKMILFGNGYDILKKSTESCGIQNWWHFLVVVSEVDILKICNCFSGKDSCVVTKSLDGATIYLPFNGGRCYFLLASGIKIPGGKILEYSRISDSAILYEHTIYQPAAVWNVISVMSYYINNSPFNTTSFKNLGSIVECLLYEPFSDITKVYDILKPFPLRKLLRVIAFHLYRGKRVFLKKLPFNITLLDRIQYYFFTSAYIYHFPQLFKLLILKKRFVSKPLCWLGITLIRVIKKSRAISVSEVVSYKKKHLYFWKELLEAENLLYLSMLKTLDNRINPYRLTHSLDDEFLISTSSGVWHLLPNGLKLVACGLFYGLTKVNKRWYASMTINASSRIVSFVLPEKNDVDFDIDFRFEFSGISRHCHQIDYLDDELYVTDTVNNRLIVFNLQNNRRRYIYPNPRICKRIPATRNNHLNSLFIKGNNIYVLAHNGWEPNVICSQLFISDRITGKFKQMIDLDGYMAHNIAKYQGKMFYIDSNGKRLVRGTDTLFSVEQDFLRGLSITDNVIIVGASGFAERKERFDSDASLIVLNHSGKILETLNFPSIGQIYEIRAIHSDYGMSQYAL